MTNEIQIQPIGRRRTGVIRTGNARATKRQP
jgi:hypothetical protein